MPESDQSNENLVFLTGVLAALRVGVLMGLARRFGQAITVARGQHDAHGTGQVDAVSYRDKNRFDVALRTDDLADDLPVVLERAHRTGCLFRLLVFADQARFGATET